MVAKLSNLEFTMEVLHLAKSYSVKCIQMFGNYIHCTPPEGLVMGGENEQSGL